MQNLKVLEIEFAAIICFKSNCSVTSVAVVRLPEEGYRFNPWWENQDPDPSHVMFADDIDPLHENP